MGIRKSGQLPEMRLHAASGNARVRVNGKTIWLGRYGTPQARARYDEVIAALVASGRRSIEAACPPASPKAPTADGVTVAELVTAWSAALQRKNPTGWHHSKSWYVARGVARSLVWAAAMPAASFGPLALQEARQRLIDTPFTRKVRGPDGRVEVRAFPRSRRDINDKIAGIRQLFRWAVSAELVPAERSHAMDCVRSLEFGETEARESEPRGPVPDDVVDATLPHLTDEMADLVRVCRLLGARPSEVARMTMDQIRDRDRPVWTYVPRVHKTRRKGKARFIPIGPRAQEIILRHAAGRAESETVFTPQRSVRRSASDCGSIPIRRKPSPRVGAAFTSAAIRVAITRATTAAGVPHWTPYALRYSRLREVRKSHGPEAAQATAGHSRELMTNHYAPASFAAAEAAALASG
jgi:integrase